MAAIEPERVHDLVGEQDRCGPIVALRIGAEVHLDVGVLGGGALAPGDIPCRPARSHAVVEFRAGNEFDLNGVIEPVAPAIPAATGADAIAQAETRQGCADRHLGAGRQCCIDELHRCVHPVHVGSVRPADHADRRRGGIAHGCPAARIAQISDDGLPVDAVAQAPVPNRDVVALPNLAKPADVPRALVHADEEMLLIAVDGHVLRVRGSRDPGRLVCPMLRARERQGRRSPRDHGSIVVALVSVRAPAPAAGGEQSCHRRGDGKHLKCSHCRVSTLPNRTAVCGLPLLVARRQSRLAYRRSLPVPIREGLNKCLLHFSDAQGESALSALLTVSVTYRHRKWWHIPVPREPLINQRFLRRQ